MSSEHFLRLVGGYCDRAGLPLPTLLPDPQGVTAFATQIEGVALTVAHDVARFPDHVYVLFTLGDPPIHDEIGSLRELLRANLLLLAPHAPTFSQHPQSGKLMMHYVLPLQDGGGEALFEGCASAVRSILHWRTTGSFTDKAAERAWPFATSFA